MQKRTRQGIAAGLLAHATALLGGAKVLLAAATVLLIEAVVLLAGAAAAPLDHARANANVDANALSRDAGSCVHSPRHRVACGGQDAARARDAAWRGLAAGADDAGRVRWWYSAATGRETRRLDEHGRLLQRRFANGDAWSWRYDEDGRLVEAIAASAGGAWRTVIEWRANDVRRILHPHENETRHVDTRGRLASRVVQRPALSPHESEYSYREDFTWDAAGRLLRHDLPEGGSLIHEHDAQGRLVRIEWRQGRQRRTLLPRAEHGEDCDGGAPATAPVLRQRLHRDPQGRLWGQHLQIGSWQAAWAYAYGADAEMIGAALGLHGVTAQQAPPQIGPQIGPQIRPQAGPRDGDASAAEPPGRRQWMYAWRPSGAALATRADSLTLRHDVQRDASGLPARAGRRSLEYGPDRRLRAIWENGRQLARYVHNAHGQRIRRHDATGTRHYLYAQDPFLDLQGRDGHGQDHPPDARHRMVAEARPLPDGAIGVTRRYVYAGETPVAIIEYPRPRTLVPRLSAAGTAPSAVESPPVFHAVHTDAHGVPYAVTDSTLRIRWRAIMSPTGAPVAEEGDLPMPLRWPGHVRDETSGWHDSGLRTYDPQAGHYLEPDPAGPTAGGSPYGYPGLPDKQMRTRAAAFGVKSQAVGTEPQAMDTEPPAARAVPCRVGNDVALPQAETMSADMRGYGKWLREALAPDPPAPHGGGPG